ncbi:hypothetical protein C8F04DRAFT_1184265 [Mycena alexandri]|uniref:Uncharacterized protein n=1 Tax=Mycena alexandri TaxID=1745969 RepID=A0AAD6STB0_9AGAR|nr:hypothetical protein C8F04DRAFT_1184265 [Mycena alexandri]
MPLFSILLFRFMIKQPKLDNKFRQLQELQAETKEIFAQLQAETIKCQSAHDALELLQKQQHNMLEEIDRCTARKLASVGRRNAFTKSMEWICKEVPSAESCSPTQFFAAETRHWLSRCNLSLENAQDRLRTLFDQVLSETKRDSEVALQALTQQLDDEREEVITQYFNDVNSTADRRLQMYNHGLRLKLMSIEGDASRLQNQVRLVNHGIEVTRAQSDLIALEGGARYEYFSADIRLLGEQLEMANSCKEQVVNLEINVNGRE